MRPRNNKGKKDFNKSGSKGPRKSGATSKRFSKDDDKPFREKSVYGKGRPAFKSNRDDRDDAFDKRSDRGRDSDSKPFREKRGYENDRPAFKPKRDDRDGTFDKRFGRGRDSERKPFREKRGYVRERPAFKKPDENLYNLEGKEKKEYFGDKDLSSNRRKSNYGEEKKSFSKRKTHNRKFKKRDTSISFDSGFTRLNKYIANAGICSRREADELIQSGIVSVNGKVITEMGFKVSSDDVVKYNGEAIRKEKMVYVLLNKPKDFITTLDDPRGRKTVLELVQKAGKERIYPVGRLDRNTTGVLLMTNDGELTAKLTHPKYGVKKMYHVTLDKNMKAADLEKLEAGVTLEDGFVKPDMVSFVNGAADKRELGVELHSGKNRVVRRMFDHLGYEVVKLDRVIFAGLTKKDLSRGRWRFLTEKEVSFLKMLPK